MTVTTGLGKSLSLSTGAAKLQRGCGAAGGLWCHEGEGWSEEKQPALSRDSYRHISPWIQPCLKAVHPQSFQLHNPRNSPFCLSQFEKFVTGN